MSNKKKIVELPTAQAEQPTPQPAPQAAPQQLAKVVIVPIEAYEAFKNWAFNTLTAANYNTISKFFEGAQQGVAQSRNPE